MDYTNHKRHIEFSNEYQRTEAKPKTKRNRIKSYNNGFGLSWKATKYNRNNTICDIHLEIMLESNIQ